MDKKFLNLIDTDLDIKNIEFVFYEHMTEDFIRPFYPSKYNELVFCTEGSCRLTFDDKTIITEKNNIIYKNKNESYSAIPERLPFSYIGVHFNFVNDFPTPYIFNRVYYPKNPELLFSLFKSLNTINKNKSIAYKLKSKTILYQILTEILLDNSSLEYSIHNYSIIENSVNYMEKNYLKKIIETKELADISHLSVSHFIRIFKSLYGTTPIKYINKLKVDRAIELLSFSNLNIQQIANKVGFPDHAYFSRVFKEHTGVSPMYYKKYYIEKIDKEKEIDIDKQ